MAHALMENRNGLIVDGWVTEASGQAERTAALAMTEKRADQPNLVTLGAGREPRRRELRQRIAFHERDAAHRPKYGRRRSSIEGRTTRHVGFAISQRIHKRN